MEMEQLEAASLLTEEVFRRSSPLDLYQLLFLGPPRPWSPR